MATAHRIAWRFAAPLHDLLVVQGRDVLDDERAAALPGFVVGRWVDAWLRDPLARARLLAMHRDALAAPDTDDAQVARRLRAAFERSALVALRIDRVYAPEGGELETEDFVAEGTPEERLTWIEIELVDTRGRPVPGRRYRVTVPDGTAHEGSLNARGFARIDGIDPGTCKVSFPDLDRESWRKA